MVDDESSVTLMASIISLAHTLEPKRRLRRRMRKAVRKLLWSAVAVAVAVGGCSYPRRPEPPAVAVPAEPDPFEPGSTSFIVSGPRFTPGETAIVKVCVSPGGTISRADLVGSSGDKRFDDYALVWARQVRLAARGTDISTAALPDAKETCGAVRVEIRAAPVPTSLGDRNNALS